MNTAEQTFVIVGAGLAGTTAAEALRTEGFDGRVVLPDDKPAHPYDRPPRSKGYLQGKSEQDKIFLHPDSWYAQQHIELRLGVQVTALDRPVNLSQPVNPDAGVEFDADTMNGAPA